MQKKTILFLDAGGPCSMAGLKILKQSTLDVVTIACDSNRYSPARLFADIFIVVPPATSTYFSDRIASIIKQYAVDILMPTFHNGFAELSKLQLNIAITDFDKGLLLQDKIKFHELCQGVGLPVPTTNLLSDTMAITGPSYIKPQKGVGSKDNFTVRSQKELDAVRVMTKDNEYIIQDLMTGVQWTAECIANELGNISTTTYIVHEFKAGNSSIIEIKPNSALVEFAAKVQSKLQLTGPFNLQVFIKEDEIKIIEINPRHGSGVEFLSLAGCQAFHYWVTGDAAYLKPAKPGIYNRYLEVAA